MCSRIKPKRSLSSPPTNPIEGRSAWRQAPCEQEEAPCDPCGVIGGQTPAQKALPWSWSSYGQSFLRSREMSCRPSPPPTSEAERALLFYLETRPPPQLSLHSPASLGVGCGRGLTRSASDALKRSQTQREAPRLLGSRVLLPHAGLGCEQGSGSAEPRLGAGIAPSLSQGGLRPAPGPKRGGA